MKKNIIAILLIVFISSQAFLFSNDLSLATQQLKTIQEAYRTIAKECLPSVVSISIQVEINKSDPKTLGLNDFLDFFRFPFPEKKKQEQTNDLNQENKQISPISPVGSGFIISKDGYIISNSHVVEKAKKVYVKLYNQDKRYEAQIIGLDKETDLAILKIKGNDFPYLEFANSDKVNVGDVSIAIGNPFDLSFTYTSGVISAKGRKRIPGGPTFQNFLQTDASVNPGNSGGPLINYQGKVIGVNSMIFSQSIVGGANLGIAFAIPSNLVNFVYNSIKKNGKVARGWLGISIGDKDTQLLKQLGVKNGKGVFVSHVEPNSPAQKSGIKSGDIIFEINSIAVANAADLMNTIASKPPGIRVDIKLFRAGSQKNIQVILGDRSQGLAQTDNSRLESPYRENKEAKKNNILEVEVRSYKKSGKLMGVEIIYIFATSPIVNKVQVGDIITSIDNKRISSEKDFVNIVSSLKSGKNVVMFIETQDGFVDVFNVQL